MRPCTIKGCGKRHEAKGLCKKHLYHFERYGVADRKRPTLRQRLLSHITVNPMNGCWEWEGAKQRHGYGIIGIKGKPKLAHRVSAMEFCGFDIQSKLFVCHKCDNRICINPEHLFFGTNTDNIHDSMKKGRFRRARGECVKSSKLTENDVRRIRALRTSSKSVYQVAEMFNVTPSCVYTIYSFRSWKHVT